jgi:hypothetical protein
MEARKKSLAARLGGLLLRCDGGRPYPAPDDFCSAYEWKKDEKDEKDKKDEEAKMVGMPLDLLLLKNPVSDAIKACAEELASIYDDWLNSGPKPDAQAEMKAWAAVEKKHKAICARFRKKGDWRTQSMLAHYYGHEMFALLALDKAVKDINSEP